MRIRRSRGRGRCGGAGRSAAAAIAVVTAVLAGGPALADVQSVTQTGGPPRLPIPTYQETGLPDFTMPVGTATFPDGSPAPEAADPPAGNGGNGGGGGGNVAQGWDAFVGQSVGSGQCVALVQAADPGVGLTRTWAQGAQVQGNTSLVPGTIIATFNAQRAIRERPGRQQPRRHLPRTERARHPGSGSVGRSCPAAYRTIRMD